MDEANPVIVRLWRNDQVESVHRGAWVLVDAAGEVLDGAGDPDQFVFTRSATKSLQALPLVESGALEHYGLEQQHLALALASHNGEPEHIEVAADALNRIGLDQSALLCGPQRPFAAGNEVAEQRIINNCSGKHAGFLAVSQHLGLDPANYLDAAGPVQQMVAATVSEMTGVGRSLISGAVDGCSAPTFYLPLRGLAAGLMRVANPASLHASRAKACGQLTAAAAAHPHLVAGTGRLCTDLMRATRGRIFAKTGAEGVYSFGVVGAGLGFACKASDGNRRASDALAVAVLRRHNLLTDQEADELGAWSSPTRLNWDGIKVGRVEVVA